LGPHPEQVPGMRPDRREVLRAVSLAPVGLAALTLPAAAAASSAIEPGQVVVEPLAASTSPLSLGRSAGFAITHVGDYAYVGTLGPYVVKVHVPTMTFAGELSLGSSSAGWPFAITTDGTDVFVATDDGRLVHRVAPTGGDGATGGMSLLGSVTLTHAAYALQGLGDHLYVAVSSNPTRIEKFATTGGGAGSGGLSSVGSLTLNSGESSVWDMAVAQGVLYALTLTAPSRVIAIEPNTDSSAAPTRLGALILETGEQGRRLVAVEGELFVLTESTPSSLVRLATTGGGDGTGGLQRLGALVIPSTAGARALATAGGFVFTGAYSSTRTVSRIALSGGEVGDAGMRIDDALTLQTVSGTTALHDATVVGTWLVFSSRTDPGYATQVATGL
jgi:hypothetical protein